MRVHLRTRVAAALLGAAALVTGAVLGGLTSTAVAAVGAPTPPYHVVKPGETLASIAREHKLSVAELISDNSLQKPYRIYVDGVLALTEPTTPLPAFTSRIEALQTGGIVKQAGCPVPYDELRMVWVTYIDFHGVAHEGSITVNASIAERTQTIFHTLYDRRFRIQAMSPMAVNMPGRTSFTIVTGGYNCRPITGGTKLSQHAYGLAVDVNPEQNPLLTYGRSTMTTARPYLNRRAYRMGMVHGGAGVATVFTANGLHWAGNWSAARHDLMHFSSTNG